MNLVLAGTYDLGKPRVRLLLAAARQVEPTLQEIHADIWSGLEDKSQLKGFRSRLGRLFRWLLAYPGLLWRLLRSPSRPVVLVPYFGLLDVLLLWPLVRLKRGSLVWDVFLSTWDTVVRDRGLLRPRSWRARLLYAAEWSAARLADRCLLDTRAHAELFGRLYCLDQHRLGQVPVGAELEVFEPRPGPPAPWDGQQPLRLLFYGQFIPLHGLDTLLDALCLLAADGDGPPVLLELVGSGQEAARIDRRLAEINRQGSVIAVERVDWVPYAQLPAHIAAADICCGIFGNSEKALSVIPNKVYQVLAMGRPLVTADNHAIRELVAPSAAIELVTPADAASLAGGIRALASRLRTQQQAVAAACQAMPAVGVEQVAEALHHHLQFGEHKGAQADAG